MSWKLICKKSVKEFKLVICDSIKLVNAKDWEHIESGKNIYLSIPYLTSLEESQSDQMEFRYVIFYSEKTEPVGIAYTQILKYKNTGYKFDDILCTVGDKIKNSLLKGFEAKVMVCGNVFCCGENGFLFSDNVSNEEAFQNLYNGLNRVRRSECSDEKISVVLFKEFWPQHFEKSDSLKNYEFTDFSIDVNMVLPIHSSWTGMDDYLQSMITKFRTKAKSVFKKSENIVAVDFDENDIQKYQSQIEELYQAVVDKAEFKFGELSAKGFYFMKKELSEKMIFRGYFLDDQLIGFSSGIINNDVLDANYVGINYDFNYTHALYQRMLYDFVEVSIQKKMKELRLGRTAEEVKSCLGALPVDMKLYLRHRNMVSNKILRPIIESVAPGKFEIRNPFKAEFVLT